MWYAVGFVFCWKEKGKLLEAQTVGVILMWWAKCQFEHCFGIELHSLLSESSSFGNKVRQTWEAELFCMPKVWTLACLYVWSFYIGENVSTSFKKTENKNVFHRANVEQRSNRKSVVIRAPNTEPKPIRELFISWLIINIITCSYALKRNVQTIVEMWNLIKDLKLTKLLYIYIYILCSYSTDLKPINFQQIGFVLY